MYAIVKTGGKQYKVAPGDKLNIEKLDAEVGAQVELQAICVVDGDKVIADPAEAGKVAVVATVLEQFKAKKVKVLKFKKRKNYKKCNGHRQQLTRVAIVSVGDAKVEAPVVVEQVEEAPADLNSLTVAQLKEMAAEKGIEVPSSAKKADIVALLENA